jgi:hypothetical protein
VVAAALAGIEGLVLVFYAVVELFNLSSARLTMGLTTSVFFLLYGVAVMGSAWGVTRGSSWARSPIVLAQFIQLGLAFSFWGHGTTPIAIGLGVTAVVVLVGLLHPASIDALAHDE